jgi:hypothetical protein
MALPAWGETNFLGNWAETKWAGPWSGFPSFRAAPKRKNKNEHEKKQRGKPKKNPQKPCEKTLCNTVHHCAPLRCLATELAGWATLFVFN